MSDDVERIAKAEFRKSHGPHHPGSPTADEIDWWATKDRRRIGTVLRDVVDGDYSWVALAPTHSLMVAYHLGYVDRHPRRSNAAIARGPRIAFWKGDLRDEHR